MDVTDRDVKLKALHDLASVDWTMYKLDFPDSMLDPVYHAVDILKVDLDMWDTDPWMLRDKNSYSSFKEDALALKAKLMEIQDSLEKIERTRPVDRVIDVIDSALFRIDEEVKVWDEDDD